MADNYQQFSEVIPALGTQERIWIEQVLGARTSELVAFDAQADPQALESADINASVLELDDWPGFQWAIEDPGTELWLYAEMNGNVINVGEFVRAFLARFRPAACWSLTWAETCSRPRVGEFSGGALFVTASAVQLCVPHKWLTEQQRTFEHAAASAGPVHGT